MEVNLTRCKSFSTPIAQVLKISNAQKYAILKLKYSQFNSVWVELQPQRRKNEANMQFNSNRVKLKIIWSNSKLLKKQFNLIQDELLLDPKKTVQGDNNSTWTKLNCLRQLAI